MQAQIGVAQNEGLQLIWEEEEEAFLPGNLHRVKCTFTSNTDQKVKLVLKPESPLKLLSPSSYKKDVKMGEKNTFSIKVYLPQTEENNMDSLSCDFVLQSMSGPTIIEEKKLTLNIKERIVIRMEPQVTQIPLSASDSLALIPIRVKNMGKKNYKVSVAQQNKSPGLKTPEVEKEFILRSKQDTLIHFKIYPDKNWDKINSTTLKYALTILNTGEKIADCSVVAFPMGHKKKFHYPNSTVNNIHEFSMGIQNRGDQQNILDFNSNGQIPVYKGMLNYQLQSFYYASPKDFQLSNVAVNYYDNNKTLSLGHLNYNDEATLSGRGFMYETGRDSQSIRIGFINGSYKLFDPSLASNTLTGNSIVGGFSKEIQNIGLITGNGIVKFRKSSNTGLFWTTHTFVKKNNSLNLRLGLSGEQSKLRVNNNAFHKGLAVSADYEKETTNWAFQSDNQFSTPRYAGNNPGNIYSNNKLDFLSWDLIKITAAARMQQSQSFVERSDHVLKRSSSIFKPQLQFETKQLGYWRLILTPYQMLHRRNFVDISNPETIYASNSSRVKILLSRKKGNASLSWNGDIGYVKFGEYESTLQQFLSYRIGVQLSTKHLGFNTSYSQGSTHLSNAIRYEKFGIKNTRFLFSTRWGKWLFNRKIKVNLSNQIAYDNINQQWSNTNIIRIKYVLPNALSLETELAHFNASGSSSIFWGVNLTKKIGTYRPPPGAKKLKLTLFEDFNNNGMWENTEKLLPGIYVKVNDIPFVTDTDGSILYKSVPPDEYQLTLRDPSGELAGEQQTISLQTDTEAHIPLYKTVQVRGMVKEIKQRFKRSKFELIGVPVIAKNNKGEVVTTYTHPDGSFAFNLPEAEYTIYVDAEAFNENFEFPDNFKKVSLTQNEPTEIALFVKVKSRKMTIQKF